MFNVKTDFGFLGRLFGVPRAWLSKVGAFCSSWTTHGNIITLERPDNPDPVHAPIRIGIDEEALGEFVDGRLPGDVGKHPVDNTTKSDLDDSEWVAGLGIGKDSVADWEAGGENGIIIQLFAVHKTEGSGQTFYPVNITLSNKGCVKKVEYVRDHGVYLGI